jgi:GxxExxY protein
VPIECSIPLCSLSQEEFHELDKEVMKHSFAIHNEMGRLFDEDIYQAELARRCCQAGLSVQREVMISVTHETFRKDFFLDLLFSRGSVYELKCVPGLVNRNDGQLINYLLLTGIQHGKLINFRTFSIESRFVSTGLTHEKRRRFQVDHSGWEPACERGEFIKSLVSVLLKEWGAFLSIDLYRDAVVHFLGGEDQVVKSVDVFCDQDVIGSKRVCLLDDRTALHLSALSQRLVAYESHLRRQLAHMAVDGLQWVNFNKNCIRLKTLRVGAE